jgi:hypothetical protein
MALPTPTDLLSLSYSGVSSWLRATSRHLHEEIFPRTNFSVMELEQAVAMLAGATVIGFSL